MKNHRHMLTSGGVDSYSNYMGETIPNNWFILLGKNRDSDNLAQSNFNCTLEQLGGEGEFIQVHRFRHWACGWFELIAIDRNNSNILKQAEGIESALESYPVLDEDDYYERESDDMKKNEVTK